MMVEREQVCPKSPIGVEMGWYLVSAKAMEYESHHFCIKPYIVLIFSDPSLPLWCQVDPTA